MQSNRDQYKLFISDKITLEIANSDIVRDSADVMISPINGLLNFDEGLANVVLNKGGYKIRQEAERLQ